MFTDLTKKLANENGEQRKLAIVLDGEVVSAPGIAFDVDPTVGITGGTAAISMGNADGGEAANNLAIILRYGALPVSFPAPLAGREEPPLSTSLALAFWQ